MIHMIHDPPPPAATGAKLAATGAKLAATGAQESGGRRRVKFTHSLLQKVNDKMVQPLLLKFLLGFRGFTQRAQSS